MNRRSFIKVLLTAITIHLGATWNLLKTLCPKTFTRADKAKNYPGSVKGLNETNMQKTAPWSG